MRTSEIPDPLHEAQHPALPHRRLARGMIIGIAVFAAVAGVLGLILLSPLMLRGIDSLGGADWTRLSEIGQTYGAASAILSALALGGVAVSLFFQARQARAQQIQVVREYYRELVRMTLDNPEVYLPCHRPIKLPGLDLHGKRQHLFVRLRMNYAAMASEVGVMDESTLRRDLLEGLFQGTAGREYWQEARHRLLVSRRRATRRFVRIVDEEYSKAIAAGPPVMGRTLAAERKRAIPKGSSAAALLGLSAGVLLGVALRRSRA
jgi:hypothetical protein